MTTVLANLQRSSNQTPWGFRLTGGSEFGTPLTINRVTPGSLAGNSGVQVGDVIASIGNADARTLTHKHAQDSIKHAGNFLNLRLERGGGGGYGGGGAGAPSFPSYGGGGARGPPPPSAYSAPPPPRDNFMGGATKPWAPAPAPAPHPPSAPSYGGGGGGGGGGGARPPWSPPARPAGGGGAGGSRKFGKKGEAVMQQPTMGRVPVCSNCGISIRGPFVVALNKSWCPDHFTCSNTQCGVNLMGIGFVEENGQLYCERDFAQYFAPKCNKCRESIIGECTKAMDKEWHPQCFVCTKCRQPLGGKEFHIEDGQPYCKNDYMDIFSTSCIGCQFPIEPGDRWVEALGSNWHSECFNCTQCQKNLEGQAFFEKNGKPYCKAHSGTRTFRM